MDLNVDIIKNKLEYSEILKDTTKNSINELSQLLEDKLKPDDKYIYEVISKNVSNSDINIERYGGDVCVLAIKKNELPNNLQYGTILQKLNGRYIVNEQLTQKNLEIISRKHAPFYAFDLDDSEIYKKSVEMTNQTSLDVYDEKWELIKDISVNQNKPIFLVSTVNKNGDASIREFNNGNSGNLIKMCKIDLPFHLNKEDILTIENGVFTVDKELSNEYATKVQNLTVDLLKKQDEKLRKNRVEGEYYIVMTFGDACNTTYLELKNTTTGEEFEELQITPDLYHYITYGSILKRENGVYKIVSGTNIKDMHPNWEITDDCFYQKEKFKFSDIFNNIERFFKRVFKKIKNSNIFK